jgi:conserved domain protein
MKKLIFPAAVALMMGLAACSQQKQPQQQQAPQPAAQVQVDSAAMRANAGEYRSYDGSKSLKLEANGQVTSKKLKFDYTSWRVISTGEGYADIVLVRAGLDHEIEQSFRIDTSDHSLVIDQETFRLPAKPKK